MAPVREAETALKQGIKVQKGKEKHDKEEKGLKSASR
jgi:hypothetical protein